MSILVLLAGLIVYFVTEYDTLGLIVTAIGGSLVLLQLIWFVFVASKVRKGFKAFDNDDVFGTNYGRKLRR